MKKEPLYLKIKSSILRQIKSGELQPKDRIPSEEALATQFGVSRMTVNKAIRDLSNEKVLIRHVGLGTFVSDLKAESPLIQVQDIAEEVNKRGNQHSSVVKKLRACQANEEIAMQMGIPIGEKLFNSLLIHSEDGLPIQVEDKYVLATIVPHYLDQDFTQLTPYRYLQQECPLSRVEHIVEAVLPTDALCDDLQIDVHEPCLIIRRRTWSDNRLVSFSLLTHPGSRYKLYSNSGSN